MVKQAKSAKSNTLQGRVSRIIFKNDDNGYRVLSVMPKNASDPITVNGSLPFVSNTGISFTFSGHWEEHPKYGLQFAADSCVEDLPVDESGIEEYLSSRYIDGIGPVHAKRIVERFGADTFRVIDESPERLLEVRGIGKKRLNKIKKSWNEFAKVRELTVFLASHSISQAWVTKIYSAYGDEAEEKISENPYILADDIEGIGFQKADVIAATFGISKEDPMRIRSGIRFALKSFSSDGHCFALKDELIKASADLLNVRGALIEEQLPFSQGIRRDISEDDNGNKTIRYYLASIYRAETGCAQSLSRIIASSPSAMLSAEEALLEVRRSLSETYNAEQLKGIANAASKKVSVLTGGPGTGKTTTIKGIIAAFRSVKAKILLAAPTGRAAKRMEESCGLKAMTIHRLLGVDYIGHFERDEENPLEGDLLILDECSMIDIWLMHSLLKAVPSGMRIVFVGDADQLPSVGPGNVLKDLISCGVIPVTKLVRIYRQKEGSLISDNAAKINNGEFPSFYPRGEEFCFVEGEGADDIGNKIVSMYASMVKSGLKDVQVLSPMKRGGAGTIALNNKIQDRINPAPLIYSSKSRKKERKELSGPGCVFREKDRVIQTVNNYELGILNGDIGTVAKVDADREEIVVSFDGGAVRYSKTDAKDLLLAYAVTIHKSQGSEYAHVIIPMTYGHYIMLQRNLLYTGVTRAKKDVVIVGEKNAVRAAVANNKAKKRNSALAERIREYCSLNREFA